MLLKDKTVAILGAGPVGLTMAKLLQNEGIAVSVYERDKDAQARIWGGTLDLHQASGQQAMKKAGLLEQYYALAIPMGRTVADAQGNVLLTKEPAYENPEINRNNLRKMLLRSLTSDTVVWDRKCTELKENNGKWRLHFANGNTATADVVIGANGGMSRVRKHVTDAEVEDTGTYIIQCEVHNPEKRCAAFYQFCDGNILMMSEGGNLLVANPSNNGVLTYNIFFKTPEDMSEKSLLDFQDTGQTTAFLLQRFSHWNECYQQLFRATSSCWGLPVRKLPLEIPWKQHRPLPVTLIGDAAHLMPPFAGEGVNTGLMDTLFLFDSLTNGKFETIQAAFDNYEKKMIAYATEAQNQSSRNETKMLADRFSFLDFFHEGAQ